METTKLHRKAHSKLVSMLSCMFKTQRITFPLYRYLVSAPTQCSVFLISATSFYTAAYLSDA